MLAFPLVDRLAAYNETVCLIIPPQLIYELYELYHHVVLERNYVNRNT